MMFASGRVGVASEHFLSRRSSGPAEPSWLFPPGPRNTCTRASALLHWLSLTRSAGVRSVEVRHGG